MDREDAVALVDRLHAAQNEFYGGGGDQKLRELLTPDITWVVPGRNSIAGEYRGIDAVFEYFSRRRSWDVPHARRDVLVGQKDRIAVLTDGAATIGGKDHSWSTVGLYDIKGGHIAACWLLPLSAADFDVIWST